MPPIDRIQQVGGHLETPPDPILDPSRVDGHVIIITGGARGTLITSLATERLNNLHLY
jgi:hypothetical protein